MYFVNENINVTECCVSRRKTECKTVKSTSWTILSCEVSITMQHCLLWA